MADKSSKGRKAVLTARPKNLRENPSCALPHDRGYTRFQHKGTRPTHSLEPKIFVHKTNQTPALRTVRTGNKTRQERQQSWRGQHD